jgi:flagellar export protein FliJ
MKRFRFPLQPVAVLRAHHEMRAQEAFAAAVNAYLKTEEYLKATRMRVAQFEATLAAGRQGRFSAAGEGQALAAYRQDCAAEAASEQVMVAARSTMQQRRSEYLDAHRRVEVVKRLEEKARSTHRHDCNREEQAAFDDLAGRRFLNRNTFSSP